MRSLREAVIVLPAFGLLLVGFFPALVADRGLLVNNYQGVSDLLDQNLPFGVVAARHLREGEIPLWVPESQNGYPFLAEGQAGFFDPINLLVRLLFPPERQVNPLLLAALFLLACNTYLFARALRLPPLCAFAAASLFSGSGFVTVHTPHLNLLHALVWLPLHLLAIRRIIERPGVRGGLLLAVATALQVTAGHPPTLFLSLLLDALLVAVGVVSRFRRKEGRRVAKIVGMAGGGVAVGFLLAAVQLVPTLELLGESQRSGGLPREAVCLGSLPAERLFTLVSPFAFGDESRGTFPSSPSEIFFEQTGYLGLLPLAFPFLLLGSASFRRRSDVRAFLALLLFGIVMALGCHTPFYRLLARLPPWNLFRMPGRYLLYVDFALAFLFAIALGHPALRRRGIRLLLLGVALFDLGRFAHRYLDTVDRKAWFTPPQSVAFLRKDRDDFRIWTVGAERTRKSVYALAKGWHGDLGPYLAQRASLRIFDHLTFGVASAAGWYSMQPPRATQVYWFLERRPRFLPPDTLVLDAPALRLLALQNVKYLLSFFRLSGEGLEEVARFPQPGGMPPLRIYENQKRLPRIRFVCRARHAEGAEGVMKILLDPHFDPEESVVLEGTPIVGEEERASPSGAPPPTCHARKIELQAGATHLAIEIETERDGYLVLADSYYPGWEAHIDGTLTPIVRADFLFRAIFLPKGRHRVTFTYRPRSFEVGKWITLLTLLLLGGGSLWRGLRSRAMTGKAPKENFSQA